MSAPSSIEKRPSFAFFVTVTIVVVLLSPGLYVALTGPALFLARVGVISDETFQMVVAPTVWADEFMPDRLVYWYDVEYLGWWDELGKGLS